MDLSALRRYVEQDSAPRRRVFISEMAVLGKAMGFALLVWGILGV
jgi:hypothetical protein